MEQGKIIILNLNKKLKVYKVKLTELVIKMDKFIITGKIFNMLPRNRQIKQSKS